MKSIKFVCADAVGEAKIDFIKKILAKIEFIEFYRNVSEDVYESLLKFCSNLKRMNIVYLDLKDQGWLHQKYDMLEYVCIDYENEIVNCTDFFEQNPNIREFKCGGRFLIRNKDWLLKTNAKLDYLNIMRIEVFDSDIYPLLNQLHEREFYKKIQLHLQLNQDTTNKISKLPIRGISVRRPIKRNFDFPKDFPGMTDAKEMDLRVANNYNIGKFFTKFPNVTRVSLWDSSPNQILPLIKQLKNLRDLFISFGWNYQIEQLNLWTLNKEREKLSGACRVTIYVNEGIFLATKRAYNNRDYKFIEIKRHQSFTEFLQD